MARRNNPLADVQSDDARFYEAVANIRKFTPDYLATLGNVSRQTMYKFNRREPISQKCEDAIIDAIKRAKEDRAKAKKTRLESADKALA